jgi:hypothetical protein
MNHVFVRRMAHVGLVITVSAALFAACGGTRLLVHLPLRV